MKLILKFISSDNFDCNFVFENDVANKKIDIKFQMPRNQNLFELSEYLNHLGIYAEPVKEHVVYKVRRKI